MMVDKEAREMVVRQTVAMEAIAEELTTIKNILNTRLR